MNYKTVAGRQVEIRKLKIKDEDILTDQQLAKEGRTFDVILNNCITGDFPIKKMFIGERADLLIRLRSLSYGNTFEAKLNCSRCGELFREDINLDELERKGIDRKKLKIDEKSGRYLFETVLPSSGKKVTMRILIGDDELSIRQIRKDHPKEIMSRLTLMRIHQLGEDRIKNVAVIQDLDVEDSVHLREVYDEHDCGIITRKEVACPNCGAAQMIDLPIDDIDFFLPSKKTKKTV